jgi:CheY-like chemotaxis protein
VEATNSTAPVDTTQVPAPEPKLPTTSDAVEKQARLDAALLALDAERQQLLDRVRAQARIFDITLSAIPDFAYIFDLRGRFLYANKALLDLWGLPLVRQLPHGRSICLIAVTGYGRPDDRDRTRDAGFDAHLVKPIDLAALERALLQRASGA